MLGSSGMISGHCYVTLASQSNEEYRQKKTDYNSES